MADYVDPTLTQQGIDSMNSKAQMAYYTSKLQGDSDTLAFQKAQAAVALAGNLSTAYGYAPGGDWYTFGAGGPTIPAAGTPTQSVMNTLGSGGAIPGYTGYNTGQTLAGQSQYSSEAATNAGLTGQLYQPGQSPYSPGTFVQVDPSQLPDAFKQAGGNYALGYVLPNGQIQQLSQQQAQQMGYTPSNTQNISYQQFNQLVNAAPQQSPQQTLASIQAYQTMNQNQNTSALATAAATGMYTAPGQMLAPGYNKAGSSFYQMPASVQQQYLSYYKDPQSAMQGWVNDTNQAIDQATIAAGGTPTAGLAADGTPQETLAAQNQYFTQANDLATQYGQYYAPGAPGQAGQAGVNAPQAGQLTQSMQQQNYNQWLQSQQQAEKTWQDQQTAAQNYLTMLSNLRGPADYAKYQQVLGATPGGMKDLVAAAAGQYIPGGGATTGVAPTPVNLTNFVGSATGQPDATDPSGQADMNSLVAPNQMAPQTWNALTPSQQQMLLGTWESQGYTKDDAQALFTQSLPKYATQTPASGTFKLQ